MHQYAHELVKPRQAVVSWSREPPVRKSEVEAWLTEQVRRAREYLRTCRSANIAAKGENSNRKKVTLEGIQSNLLPGWAILDFWRTATEQFNVFVVTANSFTIH